MADTETTEVATTETSTTEGNEEAATYVSMDEYKNQQRKLSQKDKSEREVRKQLAEFTARSSADSERTDATVAALVEALSSNELLDVSKAKSALKASQAQKQSDDYNAKIMGRLAEELNGDNFNTDEKYAQAREIWNAGRVDEAIAAVHAVNNPSETQESVDLEEFARKIKSEVMKELGRVDTGGSTATTTNTKSLDELTAVNIKRMTPAQLKEHQDALWKAMGRPNY